MTKPTRNLLLGRTAARVAACSLSVAWRGALLARRDCAGLTSPSRLSCSIAGRTFPSRTAGCRTTWATSSRTSASCWSRRARCSAIVSISRCTPITEVLGIDRAARTITVRDLRTGHSRTEYYDALVLSPGAAPIRPPLPGVDLPGVFAVRSIPDSRRIRSWIVDRSAKHRGRRRRRLHRLGDG